MVREEERGYERRRRRGAGPELDRGQGRGSATPDNTCPDYAGRDKTCCRMKGSYISWLTFSSRWSLDSGRQAGKNKTGIQRSLRHLPPLLNTLYITTRCLFCTLVHFTHCAQLTHDISFRPIVLIYFYSSVCKKEGFKRRDIFKDCDASNPERNLIFNATALSACIYK